MMISSRVWLLAALMLLCFAGFTHAQTLPTTYDLRDVNGVNYVTSVKGQQGGTCWTHGAMAAMEGNLLMTGEWENNDEDGEPNLAEYHLDWWNGFNRHNNDDRDPPSGGGLTVHYGGDYMVTSAYLTRNEGAVRDIDGQSYGVAPERYWPTYHRYYAPTIEWYTIGPNLENIDTVKQAVMDHGVVGTALCYKSSFINSSYVHYQPPSTSDLPNHAVAIVGWDDNKNTQASKDGAWLIKNSWGSTWGYGGYFWISYYDKWCCREPEMGAISYQDVVLSPYDKIYYHDYHGCRDVKTGITEAFNAFTAELEDQGEKLYAVSFFANTQNVNYTIRIYDDFDGTDLYNEISAKSGMVPHIGYYTIDLDIRPFLTKGDDFYVYVSLDKGGHAFDRTSEVPVLLGSSQRVIVESAADFGQSYYRDGGVWKDFCNEEDTGNFCLKGCTILEPAVHFEFTEGLPDGVYPTGVSMPIQVEITPGLGNYVPGTGMLNYRFDENDPFDTVPLVHLGGDSFMVDFPHTVSGAKPEYYFSADGDNGSTATSPKEVPYRYYHFECYLMELKLLDDFEIDTHWNVTDYAVSDGSWEWGDPAGTTAQPEDDHTETGEKCWVTGKAGGSSTDNDLDGGPTYLKSAPIDLAGGDAWVSFYVWFYHSTSGKQQPLEIRIANNGLSFMPIKQIKHNPQWTKYTFKVSDYCEPTNLVQFQFRAWDYPNDSTVEALIDDFQVDYVNYNPTFWADKYEINVSTAQEINFTLDAGQENAGRTYLILGSLSGNLPGTALPGGGLVHVNWDWFTDILLSCMGSPVCQDFYSTLDGAGKATAYLNTLGPIDPVVIGETATFAYLLSQPPAWDFGSNALSITFEP